MQVEAVRDRPTTLPITFEDVSFLAGDTQILARVNLCIDAGPPTLLIGPNGAGKTTLVKLATGLLAPSAGRICSAHLALTTNRTAIVFQKPVMLRRSVIGNVLFALKTVGRKADADTATRLLARVGLDALATRPARRLSAGEQQRLALARALARDPEVLFLDEPTSSLDPAATKAVEDVIVRTAAAGVKIVMATHDLGQARRLAGDVIFLAKGRLVERAPAATFFAAPATVDARTFLAGDLVI
jgi:tungstate transport system ATP-binding protein